MMDRLRNDKKRLLVEVGVMAAAFVALRFLTTWIFGPADGSGLSRLAKLGLGTVALFGLSLLVLGGTHVLFSVRRSVETMEIRRGSPTGWPPASFATKDRFSALGFEQFGSIDVSFPDHVATFAGMLSPDGSTMGIVSPAHITMVTDFSGKILNTTNQPAGAPTRYELRQSKRHGSPEELWELHRQGIAAVSENGMSPTVYNALSAMEAFLAIEEYGKTQFVISDQAKGLVGRGMTSLAHHPRGAAKIATWRDSPYRWEPKVS